MPSKVTKKTPAPAPFASTKSSGSTKQKNPLIEKRPKNFSIGQNIQPKRDLSRFVKWPEYVQVQRKRKILNMRLKVPPALAQFQNTLDKNTTNQVLSFLEKYKPESKAVKKERLLKEAAAKADGKNPLDVSSKPYCIKYGINHIVALIEQKKANMVLIANDVDPIELVIVLPALCRKMGIPYAIVHNKGRLGSLVNLKKATALAIVDVRSEDKAKFAQLVSAVNSNYTEKYEQQRKVWGGGILGPKATAKEEKRQRIAGQNILKV